MEERDQSEKSVLNNQEVDGDHKGGNADRTQAKIIGVAGAARHRRGTRLLLL